MTKKQLTEKWSARRDEVKEKVTKSVALANLTLTRVQSLKNGPANKKAEAHAKFTRYKREVNTLATQFNLINEFIKDI